MDRVLARPNRSDGGWPTMGSSSRTRTPIISTLPRKKVSTLAAAGRRSRQGDLQGGGVLGVDHRVNGQVLLQGGQVLGIGHVPNPGDGVLGAQPLGGEGTEHVDLVHVGGGQDQVCLFGPGFPQDGGGAAPKPFDAHDV